MSGAMLIVHGGAPTAVMNASLYGAIHAARASGEVDRVLGARHGARAIFSGDYIDLSAMREEELELLPRYPRPRISAHPVSPSRKRIILA